MTTLTQKLLDEALDLPTDDRMQLIDKLLQSTNIPLHSGIDKAWSEEVERRNREIENGSVKLIPGEEVIKKVKQRFSK